MYEEVCTSKNFIRKTYSLFVTILLIMVIIYLFQLGESYKEVVELSTQYKESLEVVSVENFNLREQTDYLQEVNEGLQLELDKQVSRQGSREVIAKVKKEFASNTFEMVATAYDLAFASCGKESSHPYYGITANGTNLQGKTREEAMTIAVDPKVIPMGSKVDILFPEPYTHFSGVYTASDKGGAIKGNKIDLFMGDFNQKESHISTKEFGRRNIKLRILK